MLQVYRLLAWYTLALACGHVSRREGALKPIRVNRYCMLHGVYVPAALCGPLWSGIFRHRDLFVFCGVSAALRRLQW